MPKHVTHKTLALTPPIEPQRNTPMMAWNNALAELDQQPVLSHMTFRPVIQVLDGLIKPPSGFRIRAWKGELSRVTAATKNETMHTYMLPYIYNINTYMYLFYFHVVHYIHTHIYIYIQIHIHMYIYIHIDVHTYVQIY